MGKDPCLPEGVGLMETALGIQLMRWATHRAGQTFLWGITDCTMLALEWLTLLTKHPHYEDFRGRWWSKESAVHFSLGYGRRFGQYLLDVGARECSPQTQQTGDFLVASLQGEPWDRVHVCLGGRFLSSDPEHGVNIRFMRDLAPHLILRVAPCHRL